MSDTLERRSKTALDFETPTGLRAVALNMKKMAEALGDGSRAERLRTKALEYERRARQIESTTADAPSTLRARAAYIFRTCRENPEPQWQRARLLAETYLREAEVIERSHKK